METVHLRVGSYSEASLVKIECITPLHVGAGRGLAGSVVDLPIQRDAFEFPMISASSLKGPIRQLFRKKGKEKDSIIFGIDASNSLNWDELPEVEYYAGALLVLDARLLTIPVRSLKGVYVEATCPYMLSNTATYSEVCKNTRFSGLHELLKKVEPPPGSVLVTQEAIKEVSLQLDSHESVILGDDGIYHAKSSGIVEEIATLLGLDQKKKLVICHDNDMHDHILKRAVIVTQRIKIDGDKKTVSHGGLWSEETLPQKTCFMSALFYSNSRKPNNQTSAKEIRSSIEETLNESGVMIFGGDETVGRGLCRMMLQ
jgi:CRISPR-associated protein Cmr4